MIQISKYEEGPKIQREIWTLAEEPMMEKLYFKAKVSQRANDLELSGHAAISIDGEFYDYGSPAFYWYSDGQPW